MDSIFSWATSPDGLRWLSAIMYAIFAAGLLRLAILNHSAKINGGPLVSQYPKGYFALLTIQLVPLLVTGFVIGDVFLEATRLMTLGVVIVAYAMSSTQDGTFKSPRFIFWMQFWIAAAVVVPMLWTQSETVRTLVRDYEKILSWGSIIVMILFVWKGQFVVARELFSHFLAGNYTVKRLSLQFVRFFGFAFQAAAYFLAPSAAAPIFGFDPIFLQGLIGVAGVSFVLIRALTGIFLGTRERKYRRMQQAKFAVQTV